MNFIQSLFASGITWKDVIIRVAAAIIVGVLVGLEREIANHPAGMKTNALVCLGSAITSMIAVEIAYGISLNADFYMGAKVDLSRIASGVVSGIGFIGAGAIIKSKDGSMVTGITTSATVWMSGCLGLAIGFGYFKVTVVGVIAILIVTIFLKQLETRFIKTRGLYRVEIVMKDKVSTLTEVEDYFDKKQIVVTHFDCSQSQDEDSKDLTDASYFLRIPKTIPFNFVMRDLAKIPGIVGVYEQHSERATKKKHEQH